MLGTSGSLALDLEVALDPAPLWLRLGGGGALFVIDERTYGTIYGGAIHVAIGVVLGNGHANLFHAPADGIEPLQAEADGIDQVVAARATRVREVLTQPLADGHRLLLGNRRKIGVHTRRRIGHALA